MNKFRACLVVLLSTTSTSQVFAQDMPRTDVSAESRFDAQAAELEELRNELKTLKASLAEDSSKTKDSPKDTAKVGVPSHTMLQSSAVGPDGCAVEGCAEDKGAKKVPAVVELISKIACGENGKLPDDFKLKYLADYNKGFLIRPVDPKKTPFQLKVNGWIQFRHVGFSRDSPTWTDNTGTTRAIRNRNAFDIERARLVFSGYASDPRLTYFLHLDGDTDGRHVVDFFDYWWAWKFSDSLRVQAGKRKVPGSRQWLLGARDTRLSDRPMATDFFRPDRSNGFFATGNPYDGMFYELMVGNGFRTANLNSAEINNDFAFSGTSYWEPFGAFGKPLTDHAMSSDPLVRVGHSFTWATQSGLDPNGTPLRETDVIRLADGTRLVQAGALTPGTTVSEFDLALYTVDAAIKYQGWSLNAEGYFRWLQDIQGNGPVSTTDIYQNGFFVEGGRVIVPKTLDVNVRYSQVDGPFGSASEYGAGLNWYPLDTTRLKVTFDVTQVDGSPLNNTATELLAGDSGTLFRTQIQAEF